MRNSAFLSSHPTGLPAGLTPVIVDQSPELTTRNVFEGHSYQDELDLRSELIPKSASSMSSYGVSEIPLRGRDLGQDFGSLQYNQNSFASNALSTATFDSSRSQSQATYHDGLSSSRPSTSDDGEYPSLLGVKIQVAEWGPQEGTVGTSVQATILSPFKIDPLRAPTASVGGRHTGTACTPLGVDSLSPCRYIISFQIPAQTQSQWSKPKTPMPLSLHIPIEDFDQEATVDVGHFTYYEAGTATGRPDSSLGKKRRTSPTSYDLRSPPSSVAQDSEYAGERPNKSRFGQLPPIRAGVSAGSSIYSASSHSGSTMTEDYQAPQGDGVQQFYPQSMSSYPYAASYTPSTPSWTGSASSAVLGMANPTNTVALTNDNGGMRGHNPRFVRRRNDQIASISAPGAKPQPSSFNPYSLYPNHKAALSLQGSLSDVTRDWTPREKQDKRRLVHFTRVQNGSVIHANFRPVDPDQKEANQTLISCIWREDRKECYVTSVDTISLLEALVTPETAFTVEEKNRIRRNLEGFHPETISKQKVQNEEFFKQIMGYPPPRPRHIEKDVKVFKWSTLEVALKKIISKYCASYASTAEAPRRQVVDSGFSDGTASLQSQDLGSGARTALSTPGQYAMVPSQGHGQQMPLSATSSTFGDYAHGYQQYGSSMAVRYPHYAAQTQYCGGNAMQDISSAQVLMQQQNQHQHQSQQQHHGRPAVGFGTEWNAHYV